MRKNKKTTYKTIGCVAFIIILLLSLRIIYWFFGQWQNSLWNGRTNLAIAFKGKNYLLIYINKYQRKTYVIKIPTNALFQYKSGGGEYTLDGIWRLEKMGNNKKPDLRFSFQNFFAVPIVGQYENEKMGFDDFDIKLKDVLFEKTNLTVFDYFNLKKFSSHIERFNLSDRIVPEKKIIKDEKNLIFKPEDIDEVLRDIFNDLLLSNSKYNFKILANNQRQSEINAYRRLINNIGWKVSDIEIDDLGSRKNVNKCIVQENSEYDEFLRKSFSCGVSKNPASRYSVTLQIL